MVWYEKIGISMIIWRNFPLDECTCTHFRINGIPSMGQITPDSKSVG